MTAITYQQRSPGHYTAQTDRGDAAIDREKGGWVLTWPTDYCNEQRTFPTLKGAKADVATALASHSQPFEARKGAYPQTGEEVVAFLRAAEIARNPPPDPAARPSRSRWFGGLRSGSSRHHQEVAQH